MQFLRPRESPPSTLATKLPFSALRRRLAGGNSRKTHVGKRLATPPQDKSSDETGLEPYRKAHCGLSGLKITGPPTTQAMEISQLPGRPHPQGTRGRGITTWFDAPPLLTHGAAWEEQPNGPLWGQPHCSNRHRSPAQLSPCRGLAGEPPTPTHPFLFVASSRSDKQGN